MAVEGKVAKILGSNEIVLNRGRNDGVRTGMVFEVFSPEGEEVWDPDTGETLGTVEVRVTVSHGTVDLTLRHASEAGRAALLDALPDLRRDLESSGLTCSKLDVDRESGNSWTSSQQQSAEQRAREAGTGRDRPWLRGSEPDGARPAPVVHPASSGLDVRA